MNRFHFPRTFILAALLIGVSVPASAQPSCTKYTCLMHQWAINVEYELQLIRVDFYLLRSSAEPGCGQIRKWDQIHEHSPTPEAPTPFSLPGGGFTKTVLKWGSVYEACAGHVPTEWIAEKKRLLEWKFAPIFAGVQTFPLVRNATEIEFARCVKPEYLEEPDPKKWLSRDDWKRRFSRMMSEMFDCGVAQIESQVP